jgi:hypothetical protein
LPLLCFFHGALLPTTCSSASSRNGSGIQLRWGKASLCHGDCNGGVRATDGASYVTGHSERWLEHNLRAGMARVQRHWLALWCAWASQCSSGHVGYVEGVLQGLRWLWPRRTAFRSCRRRRCGGYGHGGRYSGACRLLRIRVDTARASRAQGRTFGF